MCSSHAAIAGVAAYNNHKLKKEASRVTSETPGDGESIPLVSLPNTERGEDDVVPHRS